MENIKLTSLFKTMHRCSWVPENNSTYQKYHDEEWGVPVFDDTKLFEFLVLEGAQAGLSWETILKRREGYKKAFAGWNVQEVAQFGESDVERLLADPGIIRNKLKVRSAIINAQKFLEVKKEFGSFSDYIWQFVGGKPIINSWKNVADYPAQTDLSKKISTDLRNRGFTFVGPTIVYAHMQATGMVNDHTINCFRYNQI